MYYLDIILIVNGVMDAFLLAFTARLLREKTSPVRLFLAVLVGELPVIFVMTNLTLPEILSRILVPPAMVAIAFRITKVSDLMKGVIYFSVLAAVSGGLYYVLAGWFNLSDGEMTFSLSDLWFLPLTMLILLGGYRFWEEMQKRNILLDNILYDVELCFSHEQNLQVKALLDTGNELRDPFTGSPVMLLEEKTAREAIPEKIREFLQSPWREATNPWSLILNDEEYVRQKIVLISARGINGPIWLPGFRLSTVKIRQGNRVWEQSITVALVSDELSKENKFQALLHPEHIQKNARKEEKAS